MFVLLLIIVAGCSKEIVNEEQKIKVDIWVEGKGDYEYFNEITNSDEVQKFQEIVFNIEWENASEQLERPADYKFIFQFINPNIEAKAVTYKLWINPNNDLVEIGMEDKASLKLNKEKSITLIKILTNKNTKN